MEYVVICPRCQNDNPDTNRFCGNCGAPLQTKTAIANAAGEKAAARPAQISNSNTAQPVSDVSLSHYDPEGYDEEDAPRLSQDTIEYDNQIPLIAEPGSDRRNQVPQHIMDDVHRFLDDIHHDVDGASGTRTRADARELGEQHSVRAQARVDAALNTPARQTRRGNYLDLDDARDAREPETDRVSGPSFLGLGNSDYEYVYDDQQPSHWRRNFAFLVLIVLAGLAAVQWRSIRDMGLEYAKSGTIKVQVAKHGGQAPGDANATQQSNGTNNNGNGAPNLSVDPTRNADAENAKLHAEEEAAKAQQQAPQNNTQPGDIQPTSAANTPPALPSANTATTDNVNGTPAANNANSVKPSAPASAPANTQPAAHAANNSPSAMGAPTTSANTEEAPHPSVRSNAKATPPKKSSTQVSKTTASPSVPGGFEMQQANVLGQTPSAVPWLWSALGKGNPDAPVKLADMYITGRGVEKSCDQGLVILRSAAARGNARASARLGTLYATGICVQQNRVQAYEWMGTAAGRSPSLTSWAEQYRQALWQQMTPEERGRVR